MLCIAPIKSCFINYRFVCRQGSHVKSFMYSVLMFDVVSVCSSTYIAWEGCVRLNSVVCLACVHTGL